MIVFAALLWCCVSCYSRESRSGESPSDSDSCRFRLSAFGFRLSVRFSAFKVFDSILFFFFAFGFRFSAFGFRLCTLFDSVFFFPFGFRFSVHSASGFRLSASGFRLSAFGSLFGFQGFRLLFFLFASGFRFSAFYQEKQAWILELGPSSQTNLYKSISPSL